MGIYSVLGEHSSLTGWQRCNLEIKTISTRGKIQQGKSFMVRIGGSRLERRPHHVDVILDVYLLWASPSYVEMMISICSLQILVLKLK